MMKDHPQDEARLGATEDQMRRALGLEDATRPTTDSKPPIGSSGQRRSRHFVRDGDVPVTVIHRDDGTGTNQLEAARETIRTLAAAREELERSLATAREMIRDLQTKLAHEHIGRDEATHRFESEKQAIEESLLSAQAELAAERDARQQAEERLAEILRGQADEPAHTVPPASEQPTQRRRRGQLPRVQEAESEFVEWWKPGWQERYR